MKNSEYKIKSHISNIHNLGEHKISSLVCSPEFFKWLPLNNELNLEIRK